MTPLSCFEQGAQLSEHLGDDLFRQLADEDGLAGPPVEALHVIGEDGAFLGSEPAPAHHDSLPSRSTVPISPCRFALVTRARSCLRVWREDTTGVTTSLP